MIFGKTTAEKLEAREHKILQMINGRREFRIYAKLHDGRSVWFGKVWCYYRGGRNRDGHYFLWSAAPDTYSPFSVNSLKPDPSLISIQDI